MGRRRREDFTKVRNKDDGTKLDIKDKTFYKKELTERGWLATEEVELPSALEQAHHFINSGELNDEHYYLIRWRYYEE